MLRLKVEQGKGRIVPFLLNLWVISVLHSKAFLRITGHILHLCMSAWI